MILILKNRWVPKVLAGMMFMIGVVDVLTGLLLMFHVNFSDDTGIYAEFSNITHLELGSNLAMVVLGFILIILGRGLFQQKHFAWQWSMVLMFLSLLDSVLSHVWHTGILSLAFMILLISYRRYFHRLQNDSMHFQKMIAWLSIVMALGYGIVGSYLLRAEFKGLTSWTDAIYYTFVTYSTVGYGDIVPISPDAKMLTVSMIVVGVVSFLTALTMLLGPLIQRNITGVYKMMSSFNRLDKHVLLCGDNVLTRQVALSLTGQGKFCFFMESDPGISAALEADGFNVVHVNPENAAELKQVNLHKAVCIVSAYDDDSKNILVMMTAQSLNEETQNPSLKLIARIEQPHNLDKAKRAGATEVISPLKMSAEWVAKAVA